MIKRWRERAGGEAGFTLIELLVVMLILGILATIAILTFLNQQNKATDTQAKANARIMQTAMEACGTDNRGVYTTCDITVLRAIEKAIPQTGDSVQANPGSDSWSVTATSTSGNIFTIARNSDGSADRSCTVPSGADRGGCRDGDTW